MFLPFLLCNQVLVMRKRLCTKQCILAIDGLRICLVFTFQDTIVQVYFAICLLIIFRSTLVINKQYFVYSVDS
jgi:hypothetical protein